MIAPETIYYRGKRTKVEVVSEINGRYNHQYDELLRDEAGCWYYRRTIRWRDCPPGEPLYDYDGNRYLVHRLSLTGAILWELGINGMNGHGSQGTLRDAARDLFKQTGHPAPRARNRHAVTIHLSPVQLRMFMQVADDDGQGSMADVVLRELGQHVALHLECYHNHRLEAARARWDREAKEVA